MWSWFVSAVYPNLVASLLWAVPGFTVHHVLLKRHITKTLGGGRD